MTNNNAEQSPEISVIVPVYRVEDYLDDCIKSIVSQTFKNLEIILVDDGSPDTCPDICDAWASRDSRVRVIHKINGGLSDARNAGIAAATGEFISFIDSDDIIGCDFLRRLYEACVSHGCDIAVCGTVRFTEIVPIPHDEADDVRIYETADALAGLIDDDGVTQTVWNKLYRREVIGGILFERGMCNEDEFWTYQVIARSKKTAVIGYGGYFYRQRQGSIMGENYSLKRLDAVEAKRRRLCFLLKNYPALYRRGLVDFHLTCIYHGQLALRSLKPDETKQAYEFIEKVRREFPINKGDLSGLKRTNRFWLTAAGYNFYAVCASRNFLRIGL